ncbi:hypothetical protein IIA15_03625 [candidate division TA06 bacterium]|nr:hypothetical protein [candidate division TA06 bacterium]
MRLQWQVAIRLSSLPVRQAGLRIRASELRTWQAVAEGSGRSSRQKNVNEKKLIEFI